MSTATGVEISRGGAVGGEAADPLRAILRVDGWSTAVSGVVLLAAGRPFGDWLGLPAAWSVPFGVVFMLTGAVVVAVYAVLELRELRHAGTK